MNNKLLIITIDFIISLIWGLYFNISIALIFCAFLLVIFLIFKKWKYTILIVIAVVSCVYGNRINLEYENKLKGIEECNLVGIVISNPEKGEYSSKYTIQVISINNNKQYKNIRLLVREKKKDTSVQYGDFIKINNGKIKLPSDRRNYKGFSYKKALRSKKIYAELDIENGNIVAKHLNNKGIGYRLNKFKKCLENRINKILPKKSAQIYAAILLGDKNEIDESILNQFSAASLSHVLALSGMHINYIVVIVSYMFMFCGKRKQKYITIVFIIFYSNLTGNTFSVMRAGIMVCYYMIAKLLHRKPDVMKGLSISCLIILLNNPYAIESMSFLLSFLATLSILLFQKKIQNYIFPNAKNKIMLFFKSSISLSISANILITPVLIVCYHKLSMIFIVSNIFISVLLPLIMPISIVCLILPFLSSVLNFLYVVFLKGIELLSNLHFFNITVKRPLDVSIIFYYVTIFIEVIKDKGIRKELLKKIRKIITFLYTVILIIYLMNHTFNQDLSIHFIDVGQGDSTVITTPGNKNIIIDGGGSEEGSYIGDNVVVPYLLNRRIKCIDYMIISHFDSDHVGGLLSVLEQLKVKNVIISKQYKDSENYKRFKDIVKKKKIIVRVVENGDKLSIEQDLTFYFLWPDSTSVISDNILNNNSLVCKMEYKGFSMFFTGDIEEIAEKEFLEKHKGNSVKSTVLKVGHHGSKTSSTEEFIKAINPKIALIGVGENNKFGHPNDEVIQRLNKLNIQIYRTDYMGEITMQIDKNGRMKINETINKSN